MLLAKLPFSRVVGVLTSELVEFAIEISWDLIADPTGFERMLGRC